MNVLVLVKPVPDPEKYNEIKIDPDTKCVVREGVNTVINPTDLNALEAALQLVGTGGGGVAGDGSGAGSVTVLSMTPEFSKDKIVQCLAMGADRGYILSDKAFAGADTYATSYVLAQAIKKIEAELFGAGGDGTAYCGGAFDLILAGNSSADGGTSHVPAQVAEWLGRPCVTSACGVKLAEATTGQAEATTGQAEAELTSPVLTVTQQTEDALIEYEGCGPAVISVTRKINKPRLINAMGIIKARKKPLTIWSNEDLGLDPGRIGIAGSPTQPGELFQPDISRSGTPLEAETPAEAAAKILELINANK